MAQVSLPVVVAACLAAIFAALALAAAGWYLLLRQRRGPEAALAAVRAALDRGDWRSGLELARQLRPADLAGHAEWHEEQVRLEGECLYAASEAALREGRFADALEQYRSAAGLIGLSDEEATRRVVEAMLAEVRRLVLTQPDSPAIAKLLRLVLDRQPQQPEAWFWLGLDEVRRGGAAAGLTSLAAAHERTQRQQADAALYLGATLLKAAQPRDALRVLAEANKLAPNCPLVGWQLGTALLATGGDALLATRALQKATAADGLPRFIGQPARLWTETLPAGSWVRTVAAQAVRRRAVFHCPLGFERLGEALAAARLSLAEAYETCGRAAEAATLFADLLKAGDSVAARRGLGYALARAERYEEALPHLRAAHEREDPPTPRTTGTLALCLAHAGGDRVANARRALALLSSLTVRGDAFWARLARAVFAAAGDAGVVVSPAEVRELAAVLASTDAADATAAIVYGLLADVAPEAVRPEVGWLYVRAQQQGAAPAPRDLELFDRALSERPAAAKFFAEREWDFAAAERLYLERSARHRPGAFPTAPGPDYAARAEVMLLADSRREEAQGRPDDARATAELVLRLAPDSAAAHDRLAEIAFRQKEADRAAEWLRAWHRRSPHDPRPLARLAAIHHGAKQPDKALRRLRQALDLIRGVARAPLAFLGARVALAAGRPNEAVPLLQECVALDPTNAPALACLAAVLWMAGDFPRLTALADQFDRVRAEDPWVHFLAAVCRFVAGRLDAARDSARFAAADPAAAGAANHLLGLIHTQRHSPREAAEAFGRAADGLSGVTHDHALALRGQLAWRGGDYAEAVRCWTAVPEPRRHGWQLDVALPGAAFLAGVVALHAGKSADAARHLRTARQLGCDDPRLDALLTASRLVAVRPTEDPAKAVPRLEEALAGGPPLPGVQLRLVRAYRLLGRFADARRVLDRLPHDDRAAALQRGLLWLAEGQLIPAEKAFASAHHVDGNSAVACVNLALCRLSLGRLDAARDLLPCAAALAPPTHRRLFELLPRLADDTPAEAADWTVDDDRLLIQFLRGLARLDVVEVFAERLAAARPRSSAVRAMCAELLPLRAKDRIDRGDAPEALRLLDPSAEGAPAFVRNLLGLAAALQQDFPRAVRHFTAALPPVGDDAWVQQNLALVRGWQGDGTRATAHWKRFVGHLSQLAGPPGVDRYAERLAALIRERLRADTAAKVEVGEDRF